MWACLEGVSGNFSLLLQASAPQTLPNGTFRELSKLKAVQLGLPSMIPNGIIAYCVFCVHCAFVCFVLAGTEDECA